MDESSEVNATHQKGKTFISIYSYFSKQFSRKSPETLRTQFFRFLSMETLKTLVYSAAVENEETIQRSKNFTPIKTSTTSPRDDTVRQSMIRRAYVYINSAEGNTEHLS